MIDTADIHRTLDSLRTLCLEVGSTHHDGCHGVAATSQQRIPRTLSCATCFRVWHTIELIIKPIQKSMGSPRIYVEFGWSWNENIHLKSPTPLQVQAGFIVGFANLQVAKNWPLSFWSSTVLKKTKEENSNRSTNAEPAWFDWQLMMPSQNQKKQKTEGEKWMVATCFLR